MRSSVPRRCGTRPAPSTWHRCSGCTCDPLAGQEAGRVRRGAAAPAVVLAGVLAVTACGGGGAGSAPRGGHATAAAHSSRAPAADGSQGPAGSNPAAGSGSPPAQGGGQARPRYRYITDLSNGATARRYGYNLVDLGPYRSVIDALPAGERALVWIGNYSHATCSFTIPDAKVRADLAPRAGDPKVAGYYIDDEADYALPADGGHCPDVVAQVTA